MSGLDNVCTNFLTCGLWMIPCVLACFPVFCSELIFFEVGVILLHKSILTQLLYLMDISNMMKVSLNVVIYGVEL